MYVVSKIYSLNDFITLNHVQLQSINNPHICRDRKQV